MQQAWNALGERGLDGLTDARTRVHTRRANQMGLIFCLGTLPYPLALVFSRHTALALTLALSCIAYASPLVLNPLGQRYWARAAPLLAACVTVMVLSNWLGRDSNVHLCLFMVACWPFNLFNARREAVELLVFQALPWTCFIWIEADLPLPLDPIVVESGLLRTMSLSIGATAFAVFGLTLSYFYRRNQDNEDDLANKAAALSLEVEERSRAEQELELARQVAEEASEAKSRFLAMMSHEVRTPLHGVLGTTQLLRNHRTADGRRGLEDEERELFDTLESSGRYLTHLIDNLLDLSAMDVRTLSLRREPFVPATLVGESVAIVHSAALDRGLALEIEPNGGAGVRLLGDGPRLQQVLLNLLTNAVRYTLQGHVRVACRYVEGRLELEVSDTGPGIPDHMKQAIFQPFTQMQAVAAGVQRRGQEGVGLGLSLSQRIMQAMGGSISVHDRQGGGSVFRVEVNLPVAPAALATEPTPTAESADERPLMALIAEDNPVNCRIITKQLEKLGLQVDAVVNGALAVEAFRRKAYDIVFMDMQMPEMDGLDAIARIRAIEAETSSAPWSPRSRVPIVVVTANVEAEQRRRAHELGVDEYLTKPYRPDQLRHALQPARARARAKA